MPELPEVETVRQGLRPLEGAEITGVEVRERRLRRRVDVDALERFVGSRVGALGRRGKYLLVPTSAGGGMIVHLGMSGRLFRLPPGTPIETHDHVSWWLQTDFGVQELRFHDPRRFGLVASVDSGPLEAHPLLCHLGPEPMGDALSVDYLFAKTRNSRRPAKNTLMDSRFVAGVGNIYASEILWVARVNPKVAAGRISRHRWDAIRRATREVLGAAIEAGGTTLSDFRGADGDPGYFQVQLSVYGREGAECPRCGGRVRKIIQAGRATYYCAACQH